MIMVSMFMPNPMTYLLLNLLLIMLLDTLADLHILNYDGEYVTFYYERHEDNQRVEETIHVFDFIKQLIIHIPNEHFKVVRSYGLYAKEHKHSLKIFKMLSRTQIEIRQQLRNWRLSIELHFGYYSGGRKK